MTDDELEPAASTQEHEDRAHILSRRAKLVAAALAGLVVSCGDSGTSGGGAQPCLSIAPTGGGGEGGAGAGGTGGTGGMPMPCLEIGPSGGGGAGSSGGGGAGGSGDAGGG